MVEIQADHRSFQSGREGQCLVSMSEVYRNAGGCLRVSESFCNKFKPLNIRALFVLGMVLGRED